MQGRNHVVNSYARLALLKELAPLLRYHHMTPDFLAKVVGQCPLMQKSGLLPTVMLSVIVQHDVSPLLLQEQQMGKRDHGIGASLASWELKACFALEEVVALEAGKGISKWCELVAGYPADLRVVWRKDMNGDDTLGAFPVLYLPRAAGGVDDTLEAGVGLKWTMTLSPDMKVDLSSFFSSSDSWGWPNVLSKPWAEAVREGSPHFPGGKLEVTATVQLAVKS